MSCTCCRCPEGLIPLLDRQVKVQTKCDTILGVLRAFGETFLEVEEADTELELTVIQCGTVCYIKEIK